MNSKNYGPRLQKVMDEVSKMAEEGLISAEDAKKITDNVEEAKEANFLSALGMGGKSLLSKSQFGRLASGKLRPDEATSVHSALSLGGKSGKGILGDAERARHAINVAAAKASKTVGDDGRTFANHLDSLMEQKGGKGFGGLALPVVVGGGSIVAGAIYDAIATGKNQAAMLEANPDLYEMPEEDVRRAYATLARYAPSMTEDPFVAGSTVKKMVEFEAVDPATVKTFQDSQKMDRRIVPRLLNVFQEAAGKAAKGAVESGGDD